jgi:hypothetical protein
MPFFIRFNLSDIHDAFCAAEKDDCANEPSNESPNRSWAVSIELFQPKTSEMTSQSASSSYLNVTTSILGSQQ